MSSKGHGGRREGAGRPPQYIRIPIIPLADRPSPDVWQVIIEQVSQGQATILQDGSNYLVKFPDESKAIPFEHLAYNSEIGLYDKRQFPDI